MFYSSWFYNRLKDTVRHLEKSIIINCNFIILYFLQYIFWYLFQFLFQCNRWKHMHFFIVGYSLIFQEIRRCYDAKPRMAFFHIFLDNSWSLKDISTNIIYKTCLELVRKADVREAYLKMCNPGYSKKKKLYFIDGKSAISLPALVIRVTVLTFCMVLCTFILFHPYVQLLFR